MPYSIRSSGSKFQVVTKGTGKVHGTHSSRKDALKQMRALYANVKDAKPAKAAEGAVVSPKVETPAASSKDMIAQGWKDSYK